MGGGAYHVDFDGPVDERNDPGPEDQTDGYDSVCRGEVMVLDYPFQVVDNPNNLFHNTPDSCASKAKREVVSTWCDD